MHLEKKNHFVKKISSVSIMTYRMFIMALIVAVFFMYFWISDDAYQGYVQVVNLVENGVFGYNATERINTSTCILFEFLMIPLYYVFRDLFLSAFIIHTITNGIALYILLFKLCKTKACVVSSGVVLLGSYYFMSFCSSGLENSLIFMLGAIFINMYTSTEEWSYRKIIGLVLIDSCLLLTRMDMAILFFAPTAYICLFQRKNKSFMKLILAGITGLLPFIAWLLFSLWYYGVPFPTTYYAKLNTNIPFLDICKYGVLYLIINLLVDILFGAILIFTIVQLVKRGAIKHKIFAISIVFRLIYLITIGGDFMYGRMLTDIFFFGICAYNTLGKEDIVCNKQPQRFVELLIFIIIVLTPITDIVEHIVTYKMIDIRGGYLLYVDERYYYKDISRLQSQYKLPFVREPFTFCEKPYLDKALYDDKKDSFVLDESEGYVHNDVFLGSIKIDLTDRYIVDNTALGDMFLAYMPLVEYDFKTWRVGHNFRVIPEGYSETVATGVNVIKDESLREYYDIICELTRGDLFAPGRLKLIWDFNTGKYDYLLENAEY